ncbi:hypothetical protein ACIRPF_20475 [Streptomyces erythrochromogenes]|uniref:hypothetical protein n=1 Tax=Streptomyces erythrochromogenes TaxID=285574 RepID=UPI0002EC3223
MAEIAASLEHGLASRGRQVRVIDVDPLSARLMAADPDQLARSRRRGLTDSA